MIKKIIISAITMFHRLPVAFLLTFIIMAGHAQVKCNIEGVLRDTTQGKTVVFCPVGVDIRVSDNYTTAKVDAQGHFSCCIETDKMGLYNVFLHEQWEHGAWSNENFLVEDGATVKLCFDHDTWKIVGGGPEQTLKINMDAEADRLYRNKMKAIEKQAEDEIRPKVEALRAQGKNPEEDSLLLKRYQECMAEYEKLYEEYREWEYEYYASHPMLYALYDIAERMHYGNERYDEMKTKLMGIYHTAYEQFHPENPIHNTIRTLEAAWLLKPGKPYNDFEARTVEGEKVLASSLYKDKVAVIDFWASWCSPCLEEIPRIVAAYNKYHDRGLQVLGVAVSDKPAHTEAVIKEYAIPYPQIINAQKIAAEAYQFSAIPYTLLFDPEGNIIARGLSGEDIDKKLAEIFGNGN